MRRLRIGPAIRRTVESLNIVDGSNHARTEDRTGIFVSGMVSDWQCIGFYFGGGSPFVLKGGGVWNCVPLAVSSAIHFSTCCCTSRRPFSTPFFKFLAFTHSVIAPIASIASSTKYAVVTASTPDESTIFNKASSFKRFFRSIRCYSSRHTWDRSGYRRQTQASGRTSGRWRQ